MMHTPFDTLWPIYRLCVLSPSHIQWPESNAQIARWLGLQLLCPHIEFGNGYEGAYYKGMAQYPPRRLTIRVAYPDATATLALVEHAQQAAHVEGFGHSGMTTARQMLEAKFKISLSDC